MIVREMRACLFCDLPVLGLSCSDGVAIRLKPDGIKNKGPVAGVTWVPRLDCILTKNTEYEQITRRRATYDSQKGWVVNHYVIQLDGTKKRKLISFRTKKLAEVEAERIDAKQKQLFPERKGRLSDDEVAIARNFFDRLADLPFKKENKTLEAIWDFYVENFKGWNPVSFRRLWMTGSH